MLQKNNLLEIQLESQTQSIRDDCVRLNSPMPLRNVDLARKLGMSEGALLNAFQVTQMPAQVEQFSTKLAQFLETTNLPMVSLPLEKNWRGMLREIRDFGEVMAITRNSGAVHEKIGVYQRLEEQGDIGIFQGDIDLRLFFNKWEAGYFLIENKPGKVLFSLQFFNQYGVAIHKIYFRENDLELRLNYFLRKYVRYITQKYYVELIKSTYSIPDISGHKPARQVFLNRTSFKREWSSMRDTHDFMKLIERYDLTRLEALEQIGLEYAQELDQDSVEDVFRAAAQERILLMVFVGNESVIQIHTGLIHNVSKFSSWINILDGGFNLHLRENLISRVWLVKKPTADGIVTSVEIFDAKGEVIAMIFGERHPGQAQRCDWIDLASNLALLDCYKVNKAAGVTL